ncbi:hypothetical protein LQ327_22710 [Actinomycetospora endophytica]|uniref:Uncharacterized protein n=1 Tax=Actinomycetospora endophytica TaxID=2291215 RepID=A0ABS8PDF4_9PSEU|nr:hypothetical protein [Actinomycetospora endophytica]MCD2196189.1 hypothetical protein [Actinomycetospora endophytica]
MELGGLFRDFLEPSAAERDRAVPIVVVRGTAGSSRERILEELRDQFCQGRPSAVCYSQEERLDKGARPYQVADFLASRLMNEVPRYGRLRFPRLLLGLLALKVNLNGPMADPEAPKILLEETLSERNRRPIDKWRREFDDITRPWADKASDPWAYAMRGLSSALGLAGALASRRRPGLAWYAHGYRPKGQRYTNGANALADLVRGHWTDSNAARDDVDLTLCRAFLADIREEYSHAHWFWAAHNNALVIVDRGDRAPFTGFLEVLARLYRDPEPEWAPTLFVAGSGRSPAKESPTAPGLSRLALTASYGDWEAHTDHWYGADDKCDWGPYYPLEVDRSTPTSDDAAMWEGFVDRLVRGHPEAHRIVTGALTAAGEHADHRQVLAMRTKQGSTVAKELRDLIVGENGGMSHGLSVLAAARDLRDDSIDRLESLCDERSQKAIERYLARSLWVLGPHEADPEATPRLHPLARQVLLHELAESRRWTEVQEGLRKRAASRDGVTGLYHALAAGRLQEVTEALSAAFETSHPEAWCELFQAVVSAPVRAPGNAPTAAQFAEARVRGVRSAGPIKASLVSAAQLHRSPLGDPAHELCAEIASDIYDLRPRKVDGRRHLTALAARYADCDDRSPRVEAHLTRSRST